MMEDVFCLTLPSSVISNVERDLETRALAEDKISPAPPFEMTKGLETE
jgi:hypothetical protein